MSEKTILRSNYCRSELDDPRLPHKDRWLNARTSLVRKAIKELRREGVDVPPHGSEFVIACAAPFRTSQVVTMTEMSEIVRKFAAVIVSKATTS